MTFAQQEFLAADGVVPPVDKLPCWCGWDLAPSVKEKPGTVLHGVENAMTVEPPCARASGKE